ncbi:hypothetical protein FACS1894172_08130 [Spirochaetia bacterium]|nr:hypothetical protein FACS1894172_08130 [Spirochaetia bacterium]
MRLKDLTKHEGSVEIQCHNIPDADTIASAFAVYKYLKNSNHDTRIIYSGEQKITKPNLRLMIDRLSIPIEYVEDMPNIDTLLLVDCQYGGTNVKRFSADNIYVIDHHIESRQPVLPNIISLINNQLGSCSTIIWNMLNEEQFNFAAHPDVSTALYYGLFTDTSSLTEVSHPLDRDMLDDLNLKSDKFIINELKHNNVTPSEMKIIGAAISTYLHNPDTRYTILRADECDPTILAIIGDMAMQMQDSGVCIVYNSSTSGLRVSVRSSLRDVNAGEFAEFIANGGGHVQKAGGFISADTVLESGLSASEYLEKRIQEYFDAYDVIDAKKYNLDLLQNKYKKKENTSWLYAVN